MNVKKYKLLADDTKLVFGRTLYRIQALQNVSNDVAKGDLGGYIEKEANLSQEGKCWVYDEAVVYGDAVVTGDACVCDRAKVCEHAVIAGTANVFGSCRVCSNAVVDGKAFLDGEVIVGGNTKITDNATVEGRIEFEGLDNVVERDALVTADCCFSGKAHLTKEADCMTIKGVSLTAESVTFYRTETGAAASYKGRVYTTLDEFNDMLDACEVPQGSTEVMHSMFIQEMQVALILARLHFLHNRVLGDETD